MGIPKLLISAAVGAGLMYIIDPKAGRRRRALMHDQAVHMTKEAEQTVDAAQGKARHVRNRSKGAVAETKGFVEDKVAQVSGDTNEPTAPRRGRRRSSAANESS